jgi:hypothetical protein
MLIELMRAWRWLSGDIQGKANAEQTCCMSRKVLIKRAAGVPVSVATLGRIREGLGMDEGEGCRSRNAIQRRLPRLQRMEAMGRTGEILRTHGSSAPDDDSNDRV